MGLLAYSLLNTSLTVVSVYATADATSFTSKPSASSSLTMGVPSPIASMTPSDHLMVSQQVHSSGGDGSGASEVQSMEDAASAPSRGNGGKSVAAADVGSGVLTGLGVQQPQNTPSKRRPVLSISPPPEDLFDDSQMSFQEEPTVCGPAGADSEHSSSIWADDSVSNFSLVSSVSYNDNTEVPRKSRKRTTRQRPGPKPAPEDSMDVFDADSAKAPHFVLSQLGTDKINPIARWDHACVSHPVRIKSAPVCELEITAMSALSWCFCCFAALMSQGPR